MGSLAEKKKHFHQSKWQVATEENHHVANGLLGLIYNDESHKGTISQNLYGNGKQVELSEEFWLRLTPCLQVIINDQGGEGQYQYYLSGKRGRLRYPTRLINNNQARCRKKANP